MNAQTYNSLTEWAIIAERSAELTADQALKQFLQGGCRLIRQALAQCPPDTGIGEDTEEEE